jgi:tetratricopeptide (TPR) repeat protein
MPSREDPSPQGPLDAARRALEKEDLPGAVRHIASALGEDPNRSEALALLDEIIAAAEDPMDLVPSDDLPTPSGLAAVHAYILAEQGRVPEAIDKLLGVITERPDVLYIDWVLGWLPRPEAAGRLETDKLAGFVGALLEQFPALTAPHGGGRDTLGRMPLFVQLVRRTQPADGHFLAVAVALLCRLGNLDEALKLAREAYSLDPGSHTAAALAGTHAARNELEPALQAYRDALTHEPGDTSARLNMADLLVHHGKLQEAQELYAEVLESEPGQECAQPSYYFLRLVSGGDESWRDKLLALADEQPDNERAQRLAQQVMPYVGYLPDPPDVTANLQRAPGEGGAGEGGAYTATLPYLEAPSNYVAFEWLQRLDVTVARIQKPDPRLPRGRVDYLLWNYEGTRPRVAVAPPAPAVAHEVADLAAQPYRLDAWWGHARRLARQFGPARADDLLATMVYPPGVARVDRPAAWVYRVQAAAALVLAHLDGGWEDSVRRKALLALANGPMDWTVDAALVALASLARDEEDAAEEVARLFRELRAGAAADGTVSYYPALMWCSLRLPNLADEERDDLRQRLRQWQDARAAERHYRQALSHAEKGEYDKAVEALTETVRLDPDNADAFRERAALLLRRSKPQQAVEDFTQALHLEPGMAAAHLGRGQAHLRLGKLEQAIGDFTEAARLAPWDWQPLYRRGLARVARKEHAQAVTDFTEAIRLAPDVPEGYLQRALAYAQLGQYDRAIGDYTEQIRLNPGSPLAYNFRARLHARVGNHAAAVADHLRASELDPGNANTHSDLAWIWATCPDAAIRNGARALERARKACELTDWKKVDCLDALAAAHAESGRFDEAVQWAERAVELAREGEKAAYRSRLEAYRQGRPWREG